MRVLRDLDAVLVPQTAAAVDVEVEMLGGLVVAAVGGEAAAAVFRGDLAAEIRGDGEHLLDDGHVSFLQVGEGADVAFRDDHDVHRPIGLGVVEGEDLIGFRDDLDGRQAGEDLVAVEVHRWEGRDSVEAVRVAAILLLRIGRLPPHFRTFEFRLLLGDEKQDEKSGDEKDP